MNVTSPNEMLSGTSRTEEALHKIEEALKRDDKDEEYYHLVISGEYNREVCDEIQTIYLNAGWGRAFCRTSSENGERGGLTGLQLWRK